MTRFLPLRRGAAFDAAILVANLALVPWLATAAAQEGVTAGGLLIGAWGSLAAGAFLKRVPLQARLRLRPASEPPAGTAALVGAFVLLVMHLGLAATLLLAGSEAISGRTTGVPAILSVALGWLPTALFAAALVPSTSGRTSPWRAKPACELGADLLLGAGSVVALGWWDAAIAPQLAAARPASPWLALLLVVLLTVPFAIFYLAPRLLFLAEDYRSPGTWIGAALAMLPLAWRLVY